MTNFTTNNKMIKNTYLLIIAFALLACNPPKSKETINHSPVDFVNPLMGTDSDYSLSNGNTYPAIALPWGMNFWTPQTGKMGDGWAYTYHAKKICGIKQTHQPSPWINDYAAFSLMPEVGKVKIDEKQRASWFSHKAEKATPYYYRVYLADYDITAEVAPTSRAAIFRFTFPKSDNASVLLDAFDQGSFVKVIPEERKIIGYCTNNHGGVPKNFRNYFVAHFNKDFEIVQTWNNNKLADNRTAKGNHVGAVIRFKTQDKEQVEVKVASSFISMSQAELNLQREIGDVHFDTIKHRAKQAWNKELSRITVKGGTAEQIQTFYSCLYRVLLFPRSFYEFDKDNHIVHYSPYNGQVLSGYMFTDNGFWDTFRAVFPFFTLMYPSQDSKIMQGLVNTYKESGWLPEWASPGHRGCMIGSNSASIIADAYLKGIRGYDIHTLYQAMVKNTNSYHPKINSVGRYGCKYYNQLGYIPYDVGIYENAARTLEYAYADFCISRLAQALNRPKKEVDLFAKRSFNYQNLFNQTLGLMSGRNKDGSYPSNFNPLKWGDAFTEGNSLHYTWSVFHDIAGLKKLMGGNQSFLQTLDRVFLMPPKFDCSYYGFPIHEIREMQIANMGNYAHGNQPIQHMIYLYNYAGKPWKTQYHIRQVMNRLYRPYADGYCGDEDNGQTSAWYVFSALGFYPVCPASGEYVLGAPLFNKVELHLENGKQLTIEAPHNSSQNIYVDKLMWNNKPYQKNYISHDDIMQGGTLLFEMSNQPNKKRGIDSKSYPFSVSGCY